MPDKHDLELNEYSLASTTIEERKMDPLDYWVRKLKHFPVLAPIACDILAVPASTAPACRSDFFNWRECNCMGERETD